jgi:hypothetical protein
MADKTLEELHDDYVAAAKRHRELYQWWERTFPVTERQPGQEAPIIPPEQIDLEEEIREAWSDFLAKRNTYDAALRSQAS